MSATVADDESSSSAAPVGAVARLRERFGHLVKEFGKFGVVGGIAFLVDLLIFNLLISGAGTPPLVAKTISTVIAATLAFVGNRFWTWRHRERNGLHREYLLYFFFNAVGLGIGLACLGISHYILGNFWPAFETTLADNISGQLVGTAVGTLFRFWSYRRFVFIDAAAAPRTPSAPAAVTKGD
ncbi:GtrA family protein [Asanoa sp. NPDC050611]|uniref:GtrA family protein n=1 Tax=Asanoa sp. NPDC050611 TaxID=3157098 RepID=UPI0033C5D9AC